MYSISLNFARPTIHRLHVDCHYFCIFIIADWCLDHFIPDRPMVERVRALVLTCTWLREMSQQWLISLYYLFMIMMVRVVLCRHFYIPSVPTPTEFVDISVRIGKSSGNQRTVPFIIQTPWWSFLAIVFSQLNPSAIRPWANQSCL